jgi:hypothetical protein
MSKLIYLVGKPYPQLSSFDKIRKLGYGIGIFQDMTIELRHREVYDRIIPLDMTSVTTITEQLESIVDIEAAGLICIFENYILAKSALGTYLNLPVTNMESSKLCTDKYLMREAFMAADKTITPNYALISNEAELLEFASHYSYPLIIKPTNLVKSLLVLRCANEDELLEHYAYATENIAALYKQYHIYDRLPQIIVEEYVAGTSCSIAAFVDSTGQPHYCPGIISLETAQDIGHDDNYLYSRTLPAQTNPTLETHLFSTASKGIRALGMKSTAAHVELIYDDLGQAKIVEIGARIGGYRPRMYALSYGLDLIETELRLSLGEEPLIGRTLQAYSAVYELFPDEIGIFVGIDVNSVDISPFVYYAVKATVGQRVGPAKNGYKAVAIIIVSSEDEGIFSDVCKSVDRLRVKLQR